MISFAAAILAVILAVLLSFGVFSGAAWIIHALFFTLFLALSVLIVYLAADLVRLSREERDGVLAKRWVRTHTHQITE